MTAITGALTTIHQEAVDYRSGVSEALMSQIGAAINYINQNAVDQVGDLKTSFLTEAQFQSLRGATWVLCDGSSCVGTDYETLTGESTVPDIRGRFLRMKDNGRSLDPQGDAALGTERADTYYSHRHNIEQYYGIGTGTLATEASPPLITTNGDVDTGDDREWKTANASYHRSTLSGSSETAPKHIICNYFIKVDA